MSNCTEQFRPPHGTDLLCSNLVNTRFEDLSEDNIRIFKDRLLDMTGCIFGGAIVSEDKFIVSLYKGWGGTPEAPLFAENGRLPLPSAVMLNCIKARANDFGNMVFNVLGDHIPSHCGETLIPMNLTLADVYGISGREFITNNIAAEDLTARILYTLPVRWPMDMLLVSSAAAALASRYYKLDAEKTKTALSFAATNATDPANSYYDYSQEFKYHNGESARMGIMAAKIAKGGWRGLEDPFFGHWGLVSRQLKDGSTLPEKYEKCFEDLGKTYYTEGSFKRFPGGIPMTAVAMCGAALHDEITKEYGEFRGENIHRVCVYQPKGMPWNYYNEPFKLRNHINALFSYRFAACCALLNGTIKIRHVQTSSILEDPVLIDLAENAGMESFECEAGRLDMKVRVEMKDGKIFEHSQSFLIMQEYPSQELIKAKFWDQFNSFGKLPKAVGEKIVELAGKIDTLSDMREFTELLCLK
jgi:2-methylcitrate dehydratase PrpD